MMGGGENKLRRCCFAARSHFIGSYCEGPSADRLAVPEQLLQHLVQVVLAVVRDRERVAVVGASDHGRQTWTHRQDRKW